MLVVRRVVLRMLAMMGVRYGVSLVEVRMMSVGDGCGRSGRSCGASIAAVVHRRRRLRMMSRLAVQGMAGMRRVLRMVLRLTVVRAGAAGMSLVGMLTVRSVSLLCTV